MTIRDLSQYIKALCGEESLNLLGTNKELLLQKIYGQDPSSDQVKGVIQDVASFASNAEEQLFYEFKDSARVVLIDDHNCMQLKGFIARCRFFIGARTHATIAAYSSGIPTLVLGYSLKSKGIAKDLFGTYEHYVLPVQDLQEEYKLSQAFQWLLENETEIRNHLESTMPEYISDIEKNKDIVNGIIGNQ